MQVYELITCVRRANENAGNVISVVQFLIISIIRYLIEETVKSPVIYAYLQIDVETLHTWKASAPIGKLLLQCLYIILL